MKTCSKCKIEKPFEAFHKAKNSKDGCNTQCKECIKLRRLEIKKNPLMQLEKQIRISVILENKILSREGKRLCTTCKEVCLIEDLTVRGFCQECNKKENKEYWKKNKEKIKEYRGKNKEKIKEYQKEHSKEYYKKNKEYINETNKVYREKNKECIKEYNKQCYLKKKLERLQNESMH